MRPASTFSRIWNLSPSTLDELRREFDTAVDSVSQAVTRNRFPLSIWESEDKLVLEVDLPGVDESSLDVTVEDGVLNLTGTRARADHQGELKHAETRCGEFTRSVRLHESLDPTSVTAELNNGVLTLEISRRTESLPRRVPVTIRSKSESGTSQEASSPPSDSDE